MLKRAASPKVHHFRNRIELKSLEENITGDEAVVTANSKYKLGRGYKATIVFTLIKKGDDWRIINVELKEKEEMALLPYYTKWFRCALKEGPAKFIIELLDKITGHEENQTINSCIKSS